MSAHNLLKISDNDSSLLIGRFKGDKGVSITIKVFIQGQKEPAVKITINKHLDNLCTLMELNLHSLVTSQEAKSLVTTISSYEKDPATGKSGFKLAGVLTFNKNSEGVCSIGIKTGSYSHEYILTSASGLSNNSAQMSMRDRSNLAAETLIREIRNVMPRLRQIEDRESENTSFVGAKKFDQKKVEPSTSSSSGFNEFTFN